MSLHNVMRQNEGREMQQVAGCDDELCRKTKDRRVLGVDLCEKRDFVQGEGRHMIM